MTALARSHLYVPADRERMLEGALDRNADALIIDLEDAVAPAAKDEARLALSRWLADGLARGLERISERAGVSGPGPSIWVRINPAGRDGSPSVADLDVAVHPAVTGVIQAKCQSPDALARLDEAISRVEDQRGLAPGDVKVAPLVESPIGVLAMEALAGALRVARIQIGERDLEASLGMEVGAESAEFMPLRWNLVLVCAAAGLDPPVGPVYPALSDLEGLRRSTESLRRLGFSGRAALHPSQIPVINQVFTPTAREVERAVAAVDRFDRAVADGSGVIVDEAGSVVDEAVIRRARSVVARARVYGCGPTGGQES